jgi:hypothetical protein
LDKAAGASAVLTIVQEVLAAGPDVIDSEASTV